MIKIVHFLVGSETIKATINELGQFVECPEIFKDCIVVNRRRLFAQGNIEIKGSNGQISAFKIEKLEKFVSNRNSIKA